MKKVLFWILAVFITLASAIYQRMTGPTYPLSGKVTINDFNIKYELPRTHETTADCKVSVEVPETSISGYLEYKRFKTEDPWTKVSMNREGELLTASLPKQPAAGKLAYRVFLTSAGSEASLTGENQVVIRFKDPVPLLLLIPHIIVMFMAMLFSTRAGIEALDPRGNTRKLALWAAGLLFVGGFILGPLVQKFSFGAWWTGFPLGFDLTDNKTLIAMVGWLAAVVAGRRGRQARWWVFAASVLLLVVYLIPHSLLGSELDYSKVTPSSGR